MKNNIKEYAIDSAVRALKTFAQTGGSLITVGMLMSEISWGVVFSSACVALIYSLFMSLAELPIKGGKV